MNEHISRAYVERFAAELEAAERAQPGSLPMTPYDDEAIRRLLDAIHAEAAKPRLPWWRRWL